MDKPNAISTPADWGERIATTRSESQAPPASDNDTWADDPWTTGAVGASADSEGHNSEGMKT